MVFTIYFYWLYTIKLQPLERNAFLATRGTCYKVTLIRRNLLHLTMQRASKEYMIALERLV